MKGDEKLIQTLNSLLADELTAINQYMVHSEMCANWGYEKLHKHFEARAITEMIHAEKLIGRILFLEGMPIVSELKNISIGTDVPKQLANDHFAEEGAIKAYNDAIRLAQSERQRHKGHVPGNLKRRRQTYGWHRGASGPDRTDGGADISFHTEVVEDGCEKNHHDIL